MHMRKRHEKRREHQTGARIVRDFLPAEPRTWPGIDDEGSIEDEGSTCSDAGGAVLAPGFVPCTFCAMHVLHRGYLPPLNPTW